MRKGTVLQSVIGIMLAIAVLGPQAVTAQSTRTDSSGLTVTGIGEASAPAQSATVHLVVGLGSYGPPQAPSPDATPGAQERASIAPVISSLADVGVGEDAIETIVGPYIGESLGIGGPAIALFRIELNDPSNERITDVVNAAIVGAAQERLIVGRVNVTYGIDDCASMEREARENAIADAREQADVQAELLDVTLGDLTGARDVSYGIESVLGVYSSMPPSSGCAPIETPDTAFLAYGPPTFDPTEEPVVTVHAQIEMTFDMSVNGEATPAS